MWLRQIENIGRNFRHLQRTREVVGVFLKYGYEDVAHRLHLPSVLNIPIRQIREQQREISDLSHAAKLRRVCEELGPTFVKLGQILSTRPNLLPTAYIDELSRLQEDVPSLPFEQIRSIVERELKCPLEAVFESVDEKPLGAASIAQVHEAVLLNGDRVVVKVQRPGIRRIIEVDLEIMAQLASLIEEYVETWRAHQPKRLVKDLTRKLLREIEFTMEASQIERFAEQFAGDEEVYVPRVYGEFTTRDLLTMEYLGGIKASRITDGEERSIDLEVLASRVAHLMMKQIFVHGFFHADPHPGNIHILKGGVVAFLDFGLMGFLDQRTRESLSDLIWGIARRNEVSVVNALLRLGETEKEPPRQALEADVADLMHQHFFQPMKHLDFGKMVGQLLQLISKYRLEIAPDFFVMLKALSLTETFVRKLNPEHNLLQQAAPLLKEVRMARMHPKRLAESMIEFGVDFADFAREFPAEMRRILSQMKTGQTQIIFKHEGLDSVRKSWDQISNRISFSIVLAALIIGSSIMVYADIPPKWNDIPLIGLAGFVMAAMMGFRLLISIIKHGKM